MRILYIGSNNTASTSFHRFEAIKRLGYSVDHLSLQPPSFNFNIFNKIYSKINYITGYIFLQKYLLSYLKKNLNNTYDIVWVNSGELLGVKIIKYLKVYTGGKLVLYNNDDPTGGRDGRRFYSLLKSIPQYDLVVTVREPTFYDLKKMTSKVIRVWMSYDEKAHFLPPDTIIPDKYKSDIVFIGTYFKNEKRDYYLYLMICSGLKVSIWGDKWYQSPYWKYLKDNYKGSALYGTDYNQVIAGSKIALCFLSEGNRDLHTQRSLEIPYIGGLICAPNTIDHQAIFEDGVNAILWDTIEECIEKCKKILESDTYNYLKYNSMQNIKWKTKGNESVVNEILNSLK